MILLYWRYIVMAALAAALAVTWALYRHEAGAFTAYKVEVAAQGRVALADKTRIDKEQAKIYEDIAHEWNNQLSTVRSSAVAQYRARHPDASLQPATRCVLYEAGSGSLPIQAASAGRADGASQECLPPAGFVQDCAEDALKVHEWQEWARRNKFPIGE